MHTAQVWIEFVGMLDAMRQPCPTKWNVGLWYVWEVAIPYTSVVSKMISHNDGTLYLILQDDVLWQIELSGNALFQAIVLEIAKQF